VDVIEAGEGTILGLRDEESGDVPKMRK